MCIHVCIFYGDITIKYIAKHIHVHACMYVPLYILINGDNAFDIRS